MSFRYPAYKSHATRLSTNTLVDILQYDSGRVRCEPLVTIGQLSRHLLEQHGARLEIVPELDDLTVGGMLNGCGVESSSFKYGLFQHICTGIELITADGTVRCVDADTDADLFHAIPWSHGSLAIVTAVTLRTVPCEKYVKLSYEVVTGRQQLQDRLIGACKTGKQAGVEFIEAIAFDADRAVLMTGRMTNSDSHVPLNAIGQWHQPYFYKHVESMMFDKSATHTELIPTRDYFHRHSRSIFWEIEDIVPFGNHWLFRRTLGWAMPPKISLLKLTTPSPLRRLYEAHHVIQDVLVPVDHLAATLTRTDQLFDVRFNTASKTYQIYPLWLCPFTLPAGNGLVHGDNSNTLYIDVGIYGNAKTDGYNAARDTRALESFVRSVKG